MNFFLDTDICVFAIRGKYPRLMKTFQAVRPASVKISAIVVAELLFGARKSQHSLTAQKAVDAFLAPYEIVNFDRPICDVYSSIRLDLETAGQQIGANDLIIAATALAHHGTLVTHNTKEFARVPGLKLQDWTLNE